MSNPQSRNDLQEVAGGGDPFYQRTYAGHLLEVLHAFAGEPLSGAALSLLGTLGYRSERRIDLAPNTAGEFLANFDPQQRLDGARALLERWRSVDMLFQVTSEEIAPALAGQGGLFRAGTWESGNIQSYLFFAIDLQPQPGGDYTRTQLAAATREINKLFAMPAMVLFRHGESLTVAIIARRQNKKDAGKDVLEKVTLIKGIRYAQPHRAHIDILADLALPRLAERYGVRSFADLQAAWEKTLDTAELNKKFYAEISNWYFWAVKQVTFPAGAEQDEATRNATSVIRLITRLIFVWFLKEKGLVPAELFDRARLDSLLTWNDPQDSTYYKSILQNLFFATLNTEMAKDQPGDRVSRRFRRKNSGGGQDSHYGIPTVYRYEDSFTDPAAALALFAGVPFLNGGLFECLDRPAQEIRVDGFSDRGDNPLRVPDFLFFDDDHKIDLNQVYGTSGKQYKARGLLRIFAGYKFTVEENTPVEEEIALDPELLGKVFENLLAAYNPETGETARKQTGSFYTPRAIVDYMVDESLLAYLAAALEADDGARPPGGGRNELVEDESAGPPPGGRELQQKLRDLLAYSSEPHRLSPDETTRVIAAIDNLKVIDPACGSGAFPMGVLHKLVFLLGKLDPHNEGWQQRQLDKAYEIPDGTAREAAIAAIEAVFRHNHNDYGRKLYLIENCIYGVDIQPIAVQIAKLRCFISLVVDQEQDDNRPNRGIRALPNLETKFVAANTLFEIERPAQMGFRNPQVDAVEHALAGVRNRHFNARTHATKEKYRAEDKRLRGELAALLEADGWPKAAAGQLAAWDPYDQNTHAEFFDPQWMFGVDAGFDIVIGNPPYVRQEQIKTLKPQLKRQYTCYTGTADLYVYFFERGVRLLRPGGVLTYICSNKYFRSAYGKLLRGYLGSATRIEQLIDFGDEPVFTAIAYPSIIITQRRAPGENQVRVYTWPDETPLNEFVSAFHANSFCMPQSELTVDGWRLESAAVLGLLEKMRKAGKPLGEYVGGRLYRGIITGLNEVLVVDRATRDRLIGEHSSSAEVLKPYLRGRDVKRWRVEFGEQYLIKIESSENKKHPWSGTSDRRAEEIFEATYPAIYEHMMPARDPLRARVDQGQYYWELRSCAYWSIFDSPKIIYPDIAQRAAFSFDDVGYYAGNTCYTLPTAEKWLLGLLNSRLVFWYYTKISSQIRGDYVRYFTQFVEQIPIPQGSGIERIQQLVDQILAAKAKDPAADVSAWEAEIDRLVYALYGLTEEEIAVVEGMR